MDTQQAVDYSGNLSEPDTAMAKIADPKEWANESFDMAVKDAYAVPIGSGLGAPTPYMISADYYQMALADDQSRIALAGVRLANLLSKAMQ